MFDRLLRPKWESADRHVRRKALESGDVPSDVLGKMARADEDAGVRQCAVERVSDLELLAELIADGSAEAVREAARHRQRELLICTLHEGPPLDLRLKAVRRTASAELSTFLAFHAQVPEVRAAALERVKDTGALSRIAVDDSVAAVRRAALEKISDPRVWEVVARNARNKDKHISRVARERLEAYQKAQSDQQRAESLCGEMEALSSVTVTRETSVDLRRICNQWNKLGSGSAGELTARFEDAREQVVARIGKFDALLAQRQAICDDLNGLLETLRDIGGSKAVALEAISDSLKHAVSRWTALGQPPGHDDPLAERYARLVKQLRADLARVAEDNASAERLRKLLQTYGAILDDPAELGKQRVTAFETQWAKLAQPKSKRLTEALQLEFETVKRALHKRLDNQIRRRMDVLQEAETLVAELKEALDKGELDDALSLRDRVRHRLKISKGVAEHRRVAVQSRLQAMHAQLDQLSQWRHWGGRHARERLATEIEALTGSVLDPSLIAQRVRTARKAWKRIDRAEGPAPEPLWQRFDRACTRAYEPYQRERDAQAALRQTHLRQREALCRELDEFERHTDWKHVDWRVADSLVHNARKKWRGIGPVAKEERKRVEKAFHEALARLEARLDPERERELRRRRRLVARIKDLCATTDLRVASQEVREAQKNWRPTVQVAQKVERALWNEFRTACDTVFARIKEERDAAHAERQSNFDRKTAICDELKTLLNKEGLDSTELGKRFAKAEAEWAGSGPVPRKLERGLDVQYESLKKRLADLRREEQEAVRKSVLEGVRRRSQLCERIEVAVLEQSLTEDAAKALMEEVDQAWHLLPPIDMRHEEALRERLALANRALGGDDVARQTFLGRLHDNLDHCLELCLQIEVEAGVDSPEEFTDARLHYQVTRLSDVLQHRMEAAGGGIARLRELQVAWLKIGPLPREVQGELKQRVDRAIAPCQGD